MDSEEESDASSAIDGTRKTWSRIFGKPWRCIRNGLETRVYSQFMAHVPELFRKFNEFYMACLNGRVESEPKELARLRLARLNSSEY